MPMPSAMKSMKTSDSRLSSRNAAMRKMASVASKPMFCRSKRRSADTEFASVSLRPIAVAGWSMTTFTTLNLG